MGIYRKEILMDKMMFLLSEGLKNLWRHKLTAFTAVFSIFLTLTLAGSLIIVSDVSQSGKTIQLVTSDLMKHNPSKIKTAVIINRDHSLFPVKINFSGLNLSTSVNEHVDVVVNKQKELTVYLN